MWLNPQFPVDLVKFTEEILNGNFHFLCSEHLAKVVNLLKFVYIFAKSSVRYFSGSQHGSEVVMNSSYDGKSSKC